MADREACERRVYRLAVLLTGDAPGAAGVAEAVISAQPDLSRLDSAHLDRLTVLRCRERAPSTLQAPQPLRAAAEAMARLPAQQREARVFARVYHMPAREMARAMDCSVTAARRHLERADGAMAEQLGPATAETAGAIGAYAMTLDLPAFVLEARRARRRLRRVILVAAIVLLGLGLVTAALWWAGRVGGG